MALNSADADTEAARDDGVKAVVLQPEATQRRKEFSGSGHVAES